MLTKAQIQDVAALEDKRARDRHGLYVVEGDKLVREALALALPVETVFAHKEWIASLPEAARASAQIVAVSPAELRRLSAQATPNQALAVLKKPYHVLDWAAIERSLVLALEGIQDPGNLGSLLRVAAWFGIDDVVLSSQGADPFSPKVVQASMGALFHVRTHVLEVLDFLREVRRRGVAVYAAALGGESVYGARLEPRGVILLGNESGGLSAGALELASMRLVIPPWRTSGPGRDSLNVAMAGAIVCSEFRRRGGRGDGTGQGPRVP